ncbi:mucin-2 [Calliphora vicina]|uniref:mucin-2 n=1 Tax=Calliphora vicina TaxID=7373 RepID=UPI00325C2461
MSLKSVIFSFLLIGVATKCLVQGLQCYVCEDCNEYEDFKELHICGEISIETTAKPIILESGATDKPAVKPTSKPMLPEDPDNYLDSEESHDEVSVLNSGQKTTTKSTTTAINTQSKTTTKPTATNTQSKTTTKPTIMATQSKTTTKPTATMTWSPKRAGNRLGLLERLALPGVRGSCGSAATCGSAKPTTANPTTSSNKTEQKKPTTQSSTLKESTSQTSTAIKTTPSTVAAAAAVTPTKPKPVALPDYDDYLEYEDPIEDRRSVKSLLKINEPVCYMIKYQVNNTVFTNRGCTSFINANKYLTCQTLYNGAPMESCRICSSNGCNKFLAGESDEDDHGMPINAAGIMEKLGSIVLVICVLINRSVF